MLKRRTVCSKFVRASAILTGPLCLTSALCVALLSGCSSSSLRTDTLGFADRTVAKPIDRRRRIDTAPQPVLRQTLTSLDRAPSESQPPSRLRRFGPIRRHRRHAPHVQQSEAQCLARGDVRPTPFIRPASPVGLGKCYVGRPFRVNAAVGGRVRLTPAATLRCQMVPSIEAWVRQIVRPAARHYFGTNVIGVKVVASYGCRTRNSQPGARLSEHGRANALDIAGFKLANGRRIIVKSGWHGREDERRFLRYVHRGACEHFSTVLGPRSDRFHRDHFHLDLAHHGRRGTYRVCK